MIKSEGGIIGGETGVVFRLQRSSNWNVPIVCMRLRLFIVRLLLLLLLLSWLVILHHELLSPHFDLSALLLFFCFDLSFQMLQFLNLIFVVSDFLSDLILACILVRQRSPNMHIDHFLVHHPAVLSRMSVDRAGLEKHAREKDCAEN